MSTGDNSKVEDSVTSSNIAESEIVPSVPTTPKTDDASLDEPMNDTTSTDESSMVASKPDLETLTRVDDEKPLPTTQRQNKFLAFGIAMVLLFVFIGGWLYKDVIFDFFKGISTGKKKKSLDKSEKDKLK